MNRRSRGDSCRQPTTPQAIPPRTSRTADATMASRGPRTVRETPWLRALSRGSRRHPQWRPRRSGRRQRSERRFRSRSGRAPGRCAIRFRRGIVMTASAGHVHGPRLNKRIASSYHASACCQGTIRGCRWTSGGVVERRRVGHRVARSSVAWGPNQCAHGRPKRTVLPLLEHVERGQRVPPNSCALAQVRGADGGIVQQRLRVAGKRELARSIT